MGGTIGGRTARWNPTCANVRWAEDRAEARTTTRKHGRQEHRSRGGGRPIAISNDDLMISVDVPFEFVSEVAGAGSVTETSHVEGGATSRGHG